MSHHHSPPARRLAAAQWRKSSYSGGNDDCVEVADIASAIAVRDSKSSGIRPAVTTHAAWDCFLAAIHEGKLR